MLKGAPQKRAAAWAPVSRARPPTADDSDSDPEGEINLDIYPGVGIKVQEYFNVASEGDSRRYSQTPYKKQFTKDGLYMLAGLHATAQELFPTDYALGISPDGPLINVKRMTPVLQEDFKEWLFGSMLHLQYNCLPLKKGKPSISILF